MTNLKNNQEQIEITGGLNLGERFRQAREALQLSFDDVAKEINLRPTILTHLENNEFSHKSIPATFMKGYIRSYAKFLHLPAAEWEPVVAGLSDTVHNDLAKNSRATKSVNQYSSHSHRWVGYITILVILVVAGMTALWWWENYQQSNQERENFVQTYTQSNEPASVSVDVPASASMAEVTLDKPTEQKVTNVAAGNMATNAASKNVNRDTEATNLPAVRDSAGVASTPDTSANNTTGELTMPATSTQALQSEMAKVMGNNATEMTQATPVTSGDLVIEVTGASCWISVRDTNRKVLAQKEYKQGEILTFNEGAPYSLIIGAPGNVKITYKGEAYPLKVDGRVARFKLQ
ncbi:MAG: RodZ family helix-turn-helix domain-containing protein [[Pasteurella] mairii]|uniref:Transmembrane protein n=1 Tax=[Pasteurella] mairii TaxID=757 RepID=A0A379B2Z3_9PAST|nr:RodZ family helix-turn-helix domain-containing protein [[Pasteurella] mairii]SUB32886.1 transmembrane protein [[Pasteurella] mairii]